jgi:hypothetical protein
VAQLDKLARSRQHNTKLWICGFQLCGVPFLTCAFTLLCPSVMVQSFERRKSKANIFGGSSEYFGSFDFLRMLGIFFSRFFGFLRHGASVSRVSTGGISQSAQDQFPQWVCVFPGADHLGFFTIIPQTQHLMSPCTNIQLFC